ncbi:MAG: hypothetical protein ACRCWR_00980 [Saezia sp.]
MKNLFLKTFGGLSLSYYLRHFIFAAAIFGFYVFMLTRSGVIRYDMLFIFAINTVLYPYSRFVYESVIGFLMGNVEFKIPIVIFAVAKIFSMVLCWALALFITPLGLIYLYLYHTKQEKKNNDSGT